MGLQRKRTTDFNELFESFGIDIEYHDSKQESSKINKKPKNTLISQKDNYHNPYKKQKS